MYAQEFSAPWPIVLHEIHEYVGLTTLSLGKDRLCLVTVNISRRLVAAEELQPHINQFRCDFAKQFSLLRLQINAKDLSAHRVEINYQSLFK